jgi:hypothetical protein
VVEVVGEHAVQVHDRLGVLALADLDLADQELGPSGDVGARVAFDDPAQQHERRVGCAAEEHRRRPAQLRLGRQAGIPRLGSQAHEFLRRAPIIARAQEEVRLGE